MSYQRQVINGNNISVIKDRTSVFNALQHEDPTSVTWYDFANNNIVKGSVVDNGTELPNTKNVMCDMVEHFKQKDRYDKGQISFDQFVTRPFKQEYQDSAYKYFSVLEELKHKDNNLLEASNVNQTLLEINERDNIFEAAEINADHFAALKTASIQQVLIAIENVTHQLDSLVTTVTSNTLNDYQVMIWGDQDKLVTRDVGLDGIPTGILPPKWTTRSISSQLNGTLVTFNGNIALTAFDVDINAPITKMLQGAIEEDKQRMIAEILNGTGIFEEAIAIDWDILATNGRPSAKAHVDLETRLQSIADERLGSDVGLASQRSIETLYLDNIAGHGTNITLGGVTTSNAELRQNRINTNIPRLAGYPWVVDNLITDNTLVMLEKKAIYMNQGPRRVSSITHPILRTYGNVVLEFYKASLMFPELIRKLTSLT